MPTWTPEQVLTLAPDAASATAGKGCASAAKWVSAGASDVLAWGEAKGSGANPYQTAIDLSEPAFKCSCPSRKFPCKHALGLFLRYAHNELPNGAPPQWATDWLEKRSERAAKQSEKAAKPEAPPDPEAAAKRAEKRQANIAKGLEECQAFLEDIAAQGLLAATSARSWDQMAARMVDAQAPGVARMLKEIGTGIGVGRDWAPTAVRRVGLIALLIQAAKRQNELDDALRADVLTALGVPVKTEDLPDELAVDDTWDILSRRVTQEDRLSVCRCWMLGRKTGRWALHLAFSVGGQPFGVQFAPGSAVEAKACFYPSAWPVRVHIAEHRAVEFRLPEGEDWATVLDGNATVLAANPWQEDLPALLADAALAQREGVWHACDASGRSMPLANPGDRVWEALARTGNRRCAMFCAWDGEAYRLLSLWTEGGCLSL